MKTLKNVFVSSLSADHMGGFSGMYLTAVRWLKNDPREKEHFQKNLIGPEGLVNMFDLKKTMGFLYDHYEMNDVLEWPSK